MKQHSAFNSAITVDVRDILHFLGDKVLKTVGHLDRKVTRPAPLNACVNECEIAFIEEKKFRESASMLKATVAGVVFCYPSMTENAAPGSTTLIYVDEPRIEFIRMLNQFFPVSKPAGIHPTANLHPSSVVMEDVFIGAGTFVGACHIGAGSCVYGNCYLYDKTQIDQGVVIHAGTVIGADGFHFHRNKKNEVVKFPHYAGVVIGSDVEIGSNTSIDRGTLTDTVIEQFTKIDNLVHVGHSARIGKRCLIAAVSVIGGNAIIEDDVWIGPGCVITNNVRIGAGAKISIGSTVWNDVPAGTRVTGYAAIPHYRFLRNHQRNLQ